MAESVTQPGTPHTEEPGEISTENNASIAPERPLAESAAAEQPSAVIWTPRFLVIFAVTLVAGLSAESFLTQGWLNHFYTGQWVLQAHVLLVLCCWLAIALLSCSLWVRMGAIFGCIWAIFMTIDILISAYLNNPPLPILAHVNAAICLALLGCYICLSIDRLPFSRWDAWFLGLTPVIGITAVALTYLLTWAHDRSLMTLESTIATTALVLSTLVWWIRPSCWKARPGPTFLFGIVPISLLLLDVASMGFNAVNFFLTRVVLFPTSSLVPSETQFFFSQVVLLCLLLGAMRTLRPEILKPGAR